MINDGIKRTKKEGERISSVFAACFGTPAGKEVRAYLNNITTNRVVPNTATSNALWHHEGQRHLVMIIEQLIETNKPEGE
jgi:hypothetical protein